MKDIYFDYADELTNKIKKSEEYSKYINLRELVYSNEEMKRRLNDFRKENFRVHGEYNFGYYNNFESLIGLRRDHDDILSHPNVRDFIQAEIELGKFVMALMDHIVNQLNIDLSFIG